MKCFGHHKGKELAAMQGIYKFYEKIPLSATTCQRGGKKNRIMQPRIRTSHVYRSVDFNNLQSLEDMIQALFGNRKCFQIYHEWSESMHNVNVKNMKFYSDLNVRPVIQPARKLKYIVLYGLYKGPVLVWIFLKSQTDQIIFSNRWLCIKSAPTLLFAFALSLTLRAQKWAVVSRLDFLFSFLNSHRGEKLWQLHLIPRPRLSN